MKFLSALTLLMISFSSIEPASSATTLSFDKESSLFEIRHNTAPVLSSQFVFWYGDWHWSGLEMKKKKRLKQGRYHHAGRTTIAGTKLTLIADIHQQGARKMIWKISLKDRATGPKRSWGGLKFTFKQQKDAASHSPELLPDGSGWQMRFDPQDKPVRVSFSPKPVQLFFEQDDKREIRAYFKSQKGRSSGDQLTMTITLPPKGKIVPNLDERLASPTQNWQRNLLLWNKSPIDLSFLNKPERPAGKHGFVIAKNGHLYFKNGKRARFWGTNLTAYALFSTSPKSTCVQARRLSQLGYNLVRIHHHDTQWVEPNIFGKNTKNTRHLHPRSLERLDRWIKCLRDEGIYIWLDLLVERNFTHKDKISHFKEFARDEKQAQAKGFLYINDSLKKRIKEFNKAYLNHINPYTSLAYKDDPAILSLLLTNENDLTHHFGNALLPDANVPAHNKIYMALARKFAEKHGLDTEKVWHSWVHGQSKMFLNDVEHNFNEEMTRHLRAFGTKSLITTMNSWGDMSLAGLPSIAAGDLVAINNYGRPNNLQSNPRFTDNLTHWIAAASVAGKPLAITEWNMEPFPKNTRHNLPAYMASIGRLQDWDAMMHYAYAISGLDTAREPNNWNGFNDPATLAMMPAAALLFRQGHARSALKTYELTLPPEQFYGRNITPRTSKTIRTLTEQSALRIRLPQTPSLPWLKSQKAENKAIIISNLDKDYIPAHQNFVCSDTGELCRNWQTGVFTIDTKHSQMAMGWLGGKKIALKNITVQLSTKNASISVQSLDGAPIGTSRKLLISLATQALPANKDELPFLSEPLKGLLRITNKNRLKLYALDRTGRKIRQPLNSANGVYTLRPERLKPANWFLLQK